MPGGDRTGPMGQGPMTGRAAGYCTGSTGPGFMTPSPGWGSEGASRGYGGSRGWRRRCYTKVPGWPRSAREFGYFGPRGAPHVPSVSREQEVELLREQTKYFSDALGEISRRIDELGSPEKDE